jgi:hypothetical protein
LRLDDIKVGVRIWHGEQDPKRLGRDGAGRRSDRFPVRIDHKQHCRPRSISQLGWG